MDLSCILNSPKASAHCPSQVVRNQQKNLRMNTPLSPFTNTDNTTLLNSSGSVCHYSSQYSSVAHPGECSVAYVSPRTTSTSLSSTQPDFPLSDSVRKRKSLKPASAIVEESETSAKRKKCGACRKSFYSSTHLEIHEETVHQKLKRYKCPKCGSSFGQSGTLTRHILTVHEKRRDYQCLDVNCLKRFSSAWSLKVHIQNVHYKMRPYSCRVPGCNRAFGNLWNRRKHEKNVHGDGKNNSPKQSTANPENKNVEFLQASGESSRVDA